jgi:hypothetical protein
MVAGSVETSIDLMNTKLRPSSSTEDDKGDGDGVSLGDEFGGSVGDTVTGVDAGGVGEACSGVFEAFEQAAASRVNASSEVISGRRSDGITAPFLVFEQL